MAKLENDLEDLERDIMRRSLDPRTYKRYERKATEWFTQKLGRFKRSSKDEKTGIRRVTSDDFMKTRKGISGDPIPGQMFVYFYDPKHKATLPYYDKFPMVLVMHINADQGSMLGLNVHYLPPVLRARLLGLIRGTMKSTKLSREAKARVTYGLIKSTSQWKIAQPCLKKYLFSHIMGKVVRIFPSEWEQAVMLPLYSWAKAAKEIVWADSVSKIRGD